MITINKLNETYIKIDCEQHIGRELADYFTITIPNSQYHRFGNFKNWNGKLRLFKIRERTLYCGLISYVESFAKDKGYPITYTDDSLTYNNNLSVFEVETFCQSLKLPMKPHQHQIDSITHCLRNKRLTLVSPTGSGKSLVLYVIIRSLIQIAIKQKQKLLIIVPTTNLGELYSDFQDYSEKNKWPVDKYCHRIHQGLEKTTNKPVIISTWQSLEVIRNMDGQEAYFKGFLAVLGDECIARDTKISIKPQALKNGSIMCEKSIQDITVDDVVQTYNEKTKQLEYKHVIKLHTNLNITEQLFELTLSNNTTIKITGNHKILLTTGKWKRVDALKEEASSINTNEMVKNKGLTIIGIKKIPKESEVYNLHIQGNHNYFANGINVSNCHLCSAKTLQGLIGFCDAASYRIGLTGTIQDTKAHRLTIEGLFGKVYKPTTTSKLIAEKKLSAFSIKAVLLKHPNQTLLPDYRAELEYLISCDSRNRFIRNLAMSLKSNTLILYDFVEKHGRIIEQAINDVNNKGHKKVYLIYGGHQSKKYNVFVQKWKLVMILFFWHHIVSFN